jgi:cell division protein FtsZ
MRGARAVLVNVTGGSDLMLFEVDEAVNRIRAEVDSDANILFGSALLEDMEGRVRVSVVATGIDAESCAGYVADNVQRLHPPRRRMAESEAPAPLVASARMSAETSTVGRMVDNLAMQLETRQMTVPEPAVRREPASVIAVPPPKVQIEEPFALGGAEAPMIQEPVSHTVTMRVAPAAKKRRFGLFGLRRSEPDEYPMEPRFEASMSTAARQPGAARVHTSTPQAPAAQPSQAPALQPRNASAEDLFAGVAEDDRFEIPAFLRRQANTGG